MLRGATSSLILFVAIEFTAESSTANFPLGRFIYRINIDQPSRLVCAQAGKPLLR
jgi:hypothetical protein